MFASNTTVKCDNLCLSLSLDCETYVPFESCSVSVNNQYMIIIGGTISFDIQNSVNTFDMSTNAFVDSSTGDAPIYGNLAYSVYRSSCAAVGDTIFVFGGMSDCESCVAGGLNLIQVCFSDGSDCVVSDVTMSAGRYYSQAVRLLGGVSLPSDIDDDTEGVVSVTCGVWGESAGSTNFSNTMEVFDINLGNGETSEGVVTGVISVRIISQFDNNASGLKECCVMDFQSRVLVTGGQELDESTGLTSGTTAGIVWKYDMGGDESSESGGGEESGGEDSDDRGTISKSHAYYFMQCLGVNIHTLCVHSGTSANDDTAYIFGGLEWESNDQITRVNNFYTLTIDDAQNDEESNYAIDTYTPLLKYFSFRDLDMDEFYCKHQCTVVYEDKYYIAAPVVANRC